MTSVSVAMATYNGARHIQQQLDSLAAQSYPPAELVISDDRSEDDTLAIVQDFAETAPFPVALHVNSDRLGYRRNFMQAARLSRSELVAFCDQDDRWYPRKLAVIVEAFASPDVLLAYHNADVVDRDGTRLGSLSEYRAKRRINPPMSLGPWMYALGFTQVFRRSIVELSRFWPDSLDHNVPDEPMAHDQWYFFVASVFGSIVYHHEPLVAYVQHGGNTYGLERKHVAVSAIRFLTENRKGHIARYAQVLEHRASILEKAGSELEEPWRARARSAGKRCRELAMLYAEQRNLYSAAQFPRRLSVFGNLITKHGYRPRWGLGRRALIKDASLGVLLGPRLRRPVDA
jgi:glycosyltransferase involved in cell wall biosynthesis